jgi:hypothetical protein
MRHEDIILVTAIKKCTCYSFLKLIFLVPGPTPSLWSLFLQIILANTGDPQASHLASKLSETGLKVVYHQYHTILGHLAGPRLITMS